MAEADARVPAGEASAAHEADAMPARAGRRWGRIALMAVVPLALLVGGFSYWQSLQGIVTTDNAYLKQDRVSISSEVGGKIVEVFVRDGEQVEEGQLLFRVDPEPYRIQLARTNAALAGAQANLTALSNAPALSGVEVAAAREDIAFAQSQFERQRALWERGFTTKAAYDAAQHAVSQAQEQLRVAQSEQREAQARIARGAAVPGEDPQIAAAKAQREAAELDLRRTEVRAPTAGRVAESDRLQVGQELMRNMPVLTLVKTSASYVEANFRETDLAEMRAGQRAKLRFDAYPGMVLNGHVASIGAGTGSEFSILPAQNATGNWVKVTQRVPVRIAIDDTSPRPLIAGLSIKASVFIDEQR
jgi:membrane fusion protein (multidrug efflux system)